MKRRDVNEIAFATVQQAIGAAPKDRAKRKAEAAAMGKRGGAIGGRVRKTSLSKEQRVAIAKRAAAARWKKEPTHKAGS